MLAPDESDAVVADTAAAGERATSRYLRDRQRRELLGSRLMAVYGKVEREGAVVHVVAGRLVDLSPLLGALTTKSRDFH